MYIEFVTERSGNRAVIYARISRDKKDEGETLDGQIELCEKLAVKNGLTVVATYRESDGTGASERSQSKSRVEYDKMLAAARTGEFDYILAYADDRLTRRPAELEELIQLVETTGIKIRTHRFEHYDLSSNQGIMAARILGAVAAGEARTISERQKATFERHAYAGKPKRQRQRPFGWEEDGIHIRESEASLIRGAVEKVKAGASIASIQHEWNRAGVRTAVDPSQSRKEEKPSGEWEWSVVYRVLLGWRTAGVRTRHRKPLRDSEGRLVRGSWEPIISAEDREQALTMLGKLSRKKLRTGSWPLASLLRCGECTKPLYGQLPSGTRSRALYACKKGHVGVSAGLLEQLVIERVIERAVREEAGAVRESEDSRKQATDWPHHGELARVREQIAELMAAYKNGELSGGIVFPQVDELDQRQIVLQRELDEFLAEEDAPPSVLRRSSEALEWLLEVQGQFLRYTPNRPKSVESQRWGDDEVEETPGRREELPFAATDEETRELNLLLRGELEMVIVKKGKTGRQSRESFESRIDPVWRD
ncbi:recombinase family protein [Leucobacter tardus]|uniref:Recombinase family protein n=1 Tax=Leucobacter tardus TaxID=501483 RepID=A0A939QCG7_9MICO|nr:recombinase family protein [Leucobacter tardus]MBO2989251.1 recombinase family protein [Leucobacter tardus]